MGPSLETFPGFPAAGGEDAPQLLQHAAPGLKQGTTSAKRTRAGTGTAKGGRR